MDICEKADKVRDKKKSQLANDSLTPPKLKEAKKRMADDIARKLKLNRRLDTYGQMSSVRTGEYELNDAYFANDEEVNYKHEMKELKEDILVDSTEDDGGIFETGSPAHEEAFNLNLPNYHKPLNKNKKLLNINSPPKCTASEARSEDVEYFIEADDYLKKYYLEDIVFIYSPVPTQPKFPSDKLKKRAPTNSSPSQEDNCDDDQIREVGHTLKELCEISQKKGCSLYLCECASNQSLDTDLVQTLDELSMDSTGKETFKPCISEPSYDSTDYKDPLGDASERERSIANEHSSEMDSTGKEAFKPCISEPSCDSTDYKDPLGDASERERSIANEHSSEMYSFTE